MLSLISWQSCVYYINERVLASYYGDHFYTEYVFSAIKILSVKIAIIEQIISIPIKYWD